MSPDKRQRRGRARASQRVPPATKTRPAPNDPYQVVFFKRHRDDDRGERSPGRDFLRVCPPKIRSKFQAVLTQVASAPPPRFAGGGYWEAMHDLMAGYHEVRVDGPGRRHYRLFCKLDTDASGLGPLLVILAGAEKSFRTTMPESVYAHVRALGKEYLSRNPRSLG